jgi:hypothetical protein
MVGVKIPCNLEVYCTRTSPTEFHQVRSVKLNGFEIGYGDLDDNLLPESVIDDLRDKWCMTDNEEIKSIEHELEFEVEFTTPDEIDEIRLGFEPITDIISPVMMVELTEKAKENHIAECRDRGEVYERR